MDILITDWALNSYINLFSKKVFSKLEYDTIIRPDALRLPKYLTDPKFRNSKFWSPAGNIANGFKMKWHQIGNGLIQLRSTVFLYSNDFYLCEAYVKTNDAFDKRMLARFKTFAQLITIGQLTIRGKLT